LIISKVKGLILVELEKTWQRRLSIYWSFFWRAVAGTIVVAVAGTVLSLIVAKLSGAYFFELYDRFELIVGTPVLFVWQFVAFRMALEKQYIGFRVVLVPAPSTLDSTPVQA
jgi:hypothetical protein